MKITARQLRTIIKEEVQRAKFEKLVREAVQQEMLDEGFFDSMKSFGRKMKRKATDVVGMSDGILDDAAVAKAKKWLESKLKAGLNVPDYGQMSFRFATNYPDQGSDGQFTISGDDYIDFIKSNPRQASDDNHPVMKSIYKWIDGLKQGLNQVMKDEPGAGDLHINLTRDQ